MPSEVIQKDSSSRITAGDFLKIKTSVGGLSRASEKEK